VPTADAVACSIAERGCVFAPCQDRWRAADRWAPRRSLQAGAHPPGSP